MRIDARRRWPSRLLVGLGAALAALVVVPAGTAFAAPPPAAVAAPRPAPPATAAPPAAPPAAAARAAARTADAALRARATWETHGRPSAMVVVRSTGIDLVDQGRLTRRIPRAGSTLTLDALRRYLPAGWLTVTGGTARLSAAVVLTPNVTLDVGAPVTTLALAGGAAPADAASLYTGSGALTLRGVTVTSVDRASGQVMAPGPGRPFVLVSPGGRLTATDATLGDLGTSPTGADSDPNVQDHPGVDFHTGSTGSLVRTALPRNGTGLALDGSRDVHLEDVTVSDSTGPGLVLHGDRGTTFSGVRAEHNGTYGVEVTGPSTDRAVSGITARDNGTFGVSVDKQTGLQISGVATTADGAGGVDVQQSRGVTITGLTTTDEPVGVFTHVNTSDVVLDRWTSTGDRRGVTIEKTTDTLTVRSSTITGARVAGMAVGGQNVELRDVTVGDSLTGLRVERGAHGVTAAGLRLSGGQDGVVAGPGTSGVVLQDLTVDGVADDAVRSSSPDARIVGGRIRGGTTGIVVDAPATISGTSIGLVDEGLRTQSPGLVHADDVDVDAASVGINAEVGSPVLLTGSRVHALEAVRGTLTEQGTNDLSLPPLNLLGAIGIPVVLLALALQAVAAMRGRRFGGDARRKPPVPVNVAVGEPAEPARSARPAALPGGHAHAA
jgi:hypothetical protein